jgi:hypothetical protein
MVQFGQGSSKDKLFFCRMGDKVHSWPVTKKIDKDIRASAVELLEIFLGLVNAGDVFQAACFLQLPPTAGNNRCLYIYLNNIHLF